MGTDYDGALLPLLPKIARVTGKEAQIAGTTAGRGDDGDVPTAFSKPGGTLSIDPYVTAGTASSGLIPGLNAKHAGTAGTADPYSEQIKYRIPITTSLGRYVPWARLNYVRDTTQEPTEFISRWAAANSNLAFDLNMMAGRALRAGQDSNSGTGSLVLEYAGGGNAYKKRLRGGRACLQHADSGRARQGASLGAGDVARVPRTLRQPHLWR